MPNHETSHEMSSIDAEIARDMEIMGRDHSNSALIRAYRAWIEGNGPAVVDPDALLAEDGILPGRFGLSMGPMAVREYFVAQIGFSVPRASFVDAMRPFGPILEIGAGRGYLSQILRHAGIDAVATDLNPEGSHEHRNFRKHASELGPISEPVYCPVEPMDAEMAISSYPDRTVLCSWPSLGGMWFTDAAKMLTKGQHIAVIGEGPGGCTGDDSFYDLVHRDFAPVAYPGDEDPIWRFPGIHDHLHIFVRK
jgi:hypothetical protein